MFHTIINLDASSYLWFIRFQQRPALISVVRYISHSGDGYLYGVIGLLAFFANSANDLMFVKVGLIAFLFELPCFIIFKALIKRDRPCSTLSGSCSVIMPRGKFSMPSGHTSAAFLMATLISFYYPTLSLLAYSWASAIGLSRVILGVHYPSDIMAGTLLGSCCTFIALSLAY